MAETRFLDDAYAHEGESSAEYYDRWAPTYDAELAENAYATPARCAEALAEAGADRDAPVLDFGCGTGLSAAALRDAGFGTVDGWDVSAGMLEAARRRGLHRRLERIDPDGPLPTSEPPYAAIVAAGVIGPNVAPAATIDALLQLLPPGGLFVFSLNDHALADPAFDGRVAEWLDCGAAELVSRAHGDHIPGIDLGAVVYVLRKR
jgi:predicted TPR repeat methyltransferase